LSGQIRNFKIEIGKVYNNGVECKNPKVELANKKDIAVNCIDPSCGLYSVQLSPADLDPCLTFLVTCEECDICGTKVIKKCLCDSIDDCKACEICNENGFCESTCTDICAEDGTCIECDDAHPCKCNKECQNGKCKCPVGTTPNENGCCDECQVDGDCGVCSVCVQKNGYKECVQKDCGSGVCDLNGKCGEPGDCVECTNSGHCPENEQCNSHCTCDCKAGYIRINGVCTPVDCVDDDDCDTCEICGIGNRCVPNGCPTGKVPVVIDGVCSCVEECNCAKPDCSSKSNYCGESSIAGKCGCIPCKGNCTDGCEDPCICDEDLEKCVFNPCFGGCENGLDCGDTCGCKNESCILCESLSCEECDSALGCKCNPITGKCEKDNKCDDAPCSVWTDCEEGCDCVQGTCESCSNFSCDDCANHPGCKCFNDICQATDEECEDLVVIEKLDADCKLKGSLTKDNCCQCSPLTLDAKIKTAIDAAGNKKNVSFIVESRKGAYDGVSVDSNPLLDNISNPNIAENDTATSGTVSLSTVITYDVFKIVGSGRVPQGISNSTPTVTSASFVGGSATLNYATLSVPKIGNEEISGVQAKVVKSIKFTFTQTSTIKFPNDCEYLGGKEIGYFVIDNNSQFTGSQPIAATITSNSCRKPLFKWTKSDDGVFNETPFKKKYVSEKSPNYYEDILTSPDAESCKYFLLDPDCNCDDAVSMYVVFCNPSDFTATVTDCGKKLKVSVPATCQTNFNKDFELLVNNIGVATFKLNSKYENTFTNSSPITSVKLRLVCDTTNECTIEKNFPDNAIDPIPQAVCNGDGTVTFSFSEGSYPIGISNVTFDGVTSLGTGSPKTFTFANKAVNTDYQYRVVFTNGCTSDVKTISKEDCCNPPTIECLENGNYQVISTNGLSGILYDGNVIPSNGIIVPPTTGTKPLTYSCNGETRTKLIGTYSESDCCNILPDIDVNGNDITITLLAGTTPGEYTFQAGSEIAVGEPLETITLNNVVSGEIELTITNNASPSCKYTEPINVSDCDLGLELLMDEENCRLIARTDALPCFCPSGTVSTTITNVLSIPNDKLAVSYTIDPDINDSVGVNVQTSSLKIYANDILTSTVPLTDLNAYVGVVNIDKNCNQNSTNIVYSARVEPCTPACGGRTHALTLYLPSPYIPTQIEFNSNIQTGFTSGAPNEWYIYFTPEDGAVSSVTVTITFENTITNDLFEGTTTHSFPVIETQVGQFEVAQSSCDDCAEIKFEYEVSMSDGCSYSAENSRNICANNSYALQTVGLTKVDDVRKMEFLLFEDNVQIRRDFSETGSVVGKYEVIYDSSTGFEPGKTYKSKSICSCEEEVETSECFQATLYVVEPELGYNCGKRFEFEVSSCYVGATLSIQIGSTTASVISTGSDRVTVNLPDPLLSSMGTAIVRFNGLCEQSIEFLNPIAFVPTVSYNCTDTVLPDLSYDATITATLNGNPASVLIVSKPSGAQYGTISGANLNGVSVTTSFGVTVQLNGNTSCTFPVTLQKLCDCNVLTASASITDDDVCVINGVIQGNPIIELSTTRSNIAIPWYAISGLISLVNGSTSTLTVPYNLTTAQIPNAGSNNITIYFRDTALGNNCEQQTINVFRRNLDYEFSVNPCSGEFWSLDVDGTGITVSSPSAGTVSGDSIINIPASTGSITFTVSGSGCVKTGIVANRPSGCVSCNDSLVNGSYSILDEPCISNADQGEIRISASTGNAGCSIASVTFNGISASLGGGGYYYANIPANYDGTYDVVITDTCGCSKTIPTTVTQNCCSGSLPTISSSVSQICSNDLPESITFNITGLPFGHNLELVGVETSPGGTSASVTWTTPFSNSGGTINVTALSGSPTTIYLRTNLWSGSVGSGILCSQVSGGYTSIVNCSLDPCIGVVCPDCQHCIDNGGSPQCVSDCGVGIGCCSDVCTDLQNDESNCGSCGNVCDPGEVCCSGTCTPECTPAADIADSGLCTYSHETCATDCSLPALNHYSCVVDVSDVTISSFNCIAVDECSGTGSFTITKNSVCSFDDFNIGDIVVNFGPSISCSGGVLGGSTLNVVEVTSTSIVGNFMTVNVIIYLSSGPTDCDITYPGYLAGLFMNTGGNCGGTCTPINVIISACPTCSTC
jgi:hypothetical protein